MRPVRLFPAASVGLAVALVAAGSGPAIAATAAPTAAKPAAGSSTSELTLLTLTAADQALRAGVVQLLAETLADPAASATITPLLSGATPFGRQTVTAGGPPTAVPSRDSAALVPALAGLASVATPSFGASAGTTASSATSQVGSTGLGAVRLLGLPVAIDGTLGAVSTVTGSGSTGEQAVSVKDLALPSIADLLAGLGVDLSKLPIGVLYELLDELDLVTTVVADLKKQLDAAVATVQAQVDAAQKAVDDATAKVIAETAKLAPAQAQLKTAQDALAARTAALAPLQAAVTSTQQTQAAALTTLNAETAKLTAALAGNTLALYESTPLLKATLGPVVEPLKTTVAAAQKAYDDATAAVNKATADLAAARSLEDVARAAVTAAQSAVAVVQGLIDAAQKLLTDALAALDAVLAPVLPQIRALLGAVTAVLDGTPLVSLGALDVVARTTVTSATEGGQKAEVIGGQVSGLKVLGTDVLTDVLGKTTVEVASLTRDQLAGVDALVGRLTGTLSSVLSTVPGFPSLSIPAPKVEVLQGTSSTGVEDGFGTATAGLQLLKVSLPAITLPLGLQLPGAASLPALGALPGTVRTSAVGDLTSTPVSLAVGTVGPQSTFRPAVAATGTPTTGTPTTGTPTTGTPAAGTPGTRTPVQQLPRTGATALVALMGVALLGTGLWLRRRPEVAAEL